MANEKKNFLQRLAEEIAGTTMNLAGFVNPAMKTQGEYLCWGELPVKLPEPSDLCLMFKRNYISYDVYIKAMRQHGYSTDNANLLLGLNHQFLTPQEYVQIHNRGDMTDQDYEYIMNMIGAKYQKYYFEQSVAYFPSAPDLVRFAVREVYTPATEEKFGQLKDLPPEFISEAKKAGIPEKQAKNFWSSHWELPSMTEVFEMYHRTTDTKIDEDADSITMPSGATIYNVIGKKTVDMAIKALDVMPYWRDKMRTISYLPLTRVDIRRMYSLGAIDEDKVFRSYLDEGYSQENALALTKFVVKEYSQEMHGVTRGVLDKAFKEDIISEDDYRISLKKLKLSDDTIDFYVTMADYDKHIANVKLLIQTLTIRYEDGELTLDQVRAEIQKENVPTSLVESTLLKIQTHSRQKRKLVEKSDVIEWYKSGIIDHDIFFAKMGALGYDKQDIMYYEQHINNKINKEVK